MRSKKNIGILIVAIVVLLGFAGSLLVYRNKLPSKESNVDLSQENTLKNYVYATEEENIVYDSIKHVKYVNNELEVIVEKGTKLIDIHELAKKYNAEIVGEIEIFNAYQFKLNEIFTLNQLEELATDIRKSSFVLDVNINYAWDNLYNTYTINKGDIWKNETWNEETPNGKNWGIEAIQCISAWDLLNKKAINPVRIGLIDNAFDENHEDLGFVKTYYNCSHSELLKYVSENDDYEHGTNVAGVMAANSELDSHGSDVGICGVYPFGNGNLYGVSFVGASKTNIAIESYLVTLIVENNVKVINISCLGDVNLTFRASHLNEDSAKNEFKRISFPIEKKLIELIKLKYDFLICTSAGNESYGWFKENKNGEYEQIGDAWNVFSATKTDIVDAKYGSLFASIDNEELKKRIVVVGAVELEKNHMQICSYSNGGKRVDIYAPGEKITTTSVDNKYRYYFNGTSAAAPFVSGTAAMIWSVNNNLTGEKVKEILCNTAKCPENAGSEYFKMVNAKLAVEEAIRRADTLVVPIEDETQSSEPVEIKDIESTEATWDSISQNNTTETEVSAGIIDSGTCGDNLTWTLDSNGQLTIEGTGEMYNYYTPYKKDADSPPWRYQKIQSVVIKSGVTSIGNGAFGWQDDLGNVSIADTVTSIGVYSFFSCDGLVYLDSVYQIPESITSIGKGAFDLCCNMRCVYVGKNVTKLDDYSLDSEYLITIYGYEGSEAQAYAGRNGISFVCVDDDYGYHGTISNPNGASFRSGSSEKSKEISVIPYGTEVSEYDSTGDWALIKYNGTLGYVYKDDLLFEGGFAKPVIYLYPEKKQDISVKVNFKNGDFTCTYPEYNNGWNVTAYPNGRIINKSDNDEYSYLYWEGEGAIQYDFSSGFVVKREDTAEFLKEKLSYMGLSPKEYNEFIVYWLPIMQKNEYNLISFQMENYEESAQLEVSPKPDSMLRVFMAFQEADANTKIPEQQLKTFQRTGFTVIEWGGTEVK